MAFALGIINNQSRLSLHLIRDVRNKFAHRIEPLTFDHPSVAELMTVRAMPSVQALKSSIRQQFLTTFHGLAVVLYGTLAADIRIKPLEQTHERHFLEVLLKVHTTRQAAAQASAASEPNQPEHE